MVGRCTWLLIVMTAVGCTAKQDSTATSAAMCDTSIKYSWDDVNQQTRKTTEYRNTVTGLCSEERLALSVYEQGLDYRRRNHVTCTPQSIASVWLQADGGYYTYRSGRVSLELDASTGQFRRISTGITSDVHQAGAGKPAFSRDLGCFYVRTSPDGTQWLLLDLGPNKASSEDSKPSEVFRITVQGDHWITTRQDDNDGIDGTTCPASLVPEPYCDALRALAPYLLPDLDAATEAELFRETLLIRSEYVYAVTTKASFDGLWNEAEKNSVETLLQSFQYEPLLPMDPPLYLDALAAYIRGAGPMPDITVNMPPVVCYPARRRVTYSDGSTGYISGTACYDGSGGYDFY